MRAIETVKTVEIPDGVEGMLDGRLVTIKGEKGELTRDFSHAPIKIQLDGKTVENSNSSGELAPQKGSSPRGNY